MLRISPDFALTVITKEIIGNCVDKNKKILIFYFFALKYSVI